jgi:uncharacterized protein YkwD
LFAASLASVLFATALLPAADAAGRAAPCGESSMAPRRLSLHEMRVSVLCLINRVRAHDGLATLDENPDLQAAADAHSVSMVVHDYFAHEGPGGSMDSRISRAGYLASAGRFTIGEDIGGGDGIWGSPLAIFKDWMRSPPHRENILDPGYRDAGVGVARGFPLGGRAGAATYTVDFGARTH